MINSHDITKCAACGTENTKGLVACSLFGAMSAYYCEDCLKAGKDVYSYMVAYIASAGRFPEDINSSFQQEVRRQLKLHGKTEEEFIADVEASIKEELEFRMSPYFTTSIVQEDF